MKRKRYSEAERLIDQQLANTEHAKSGGRFSPFTSRRQSRPTESRTDDSGLYRLEYPSKRILT